MEFDGTYILANIIGKKAFQVSFDLISWCADSKPTSVRIRPGRSLQGQRKGEVRQLLCTHEVVPTEEIGQAMRSIFSQWNSATKFSEGPEETQSKRGVCTLLKPMDKSHKTSNLLK